MAACVGYFGKIPALGDFVRRNVPPGFVEGWDPWLQAGLAESRATLGADWLGFYQVAPIWRFALGAGLCGREAVLGILMPSQDRVGRYFPLTLVVPSTPDRILAAFADETLLGAMEDCALDALDPDFGRTALDAALAALRVQPGDAGDTLAGSVWRVRTEEGETELCCTGMPPPSQFATFLDLSTGRWQAAA